MSSCQSRGKLWWNIWNNKWGWCTQDMTRGLHAKWPDINLSPAGGEREIVNDYLGQNNISSPFLWSRKFQRANKFMCFGFNSRKKCCPKLLEGQFIKIHWVWQPLLIINVISATEQNTHFSQSFLHKKLLEGGHKNRRIKFSYFAVTPHPPRVQRFFYILVWIWSIYTILIFQNNNP